MTTSVQPTGPTTAELAAQFGLEHSGAPVRVTGIVLDNRLVSAGDLFAALPGAHTHGADFAAAALAAGAVAVLTDPDGAQRLDASGVPVLVAEQIRDVLGPLSAFLYGHPAEALRTFAVTGTNGKTTTTYLIEDMLRRSGATTGLIGTVELRIAGEHVPARLTTPEAPAIQALLGRMVGQGVRDLAMEVSSHALTQGRVGGITYDMVGFTNLTADHLDFHGGIEHYFAAKAQLFTPEHARRGVVLLDDEWGRRMARAAQIPVVTLTTLDDGPAADWRLSALQAHPDHSTFTLTRSDGTTVSTAIWMPGRFNVANAALALVMLLESGLPPQQLAEVISGGLRPHVPGRMEQVCDQPRCIVDFAHNAEAMELVLDALRPTTRGRLIVVFGATGERDVAKREVMGKVAVTGADVVIVTDDDPHDEDAATIRRHVLAGANAAAGQAPDRGRHTVVQEVAPRAEAIRQAIAQAAAADTVLIAGRGHETVQEIAGVEYHLDDREEVRAALAAQGTRQ